MKSVAVILVNWNGLSDTLSCLGSLAALKKGPYSVRTIVVDNGSTDGSPDVIRKRYPGTELVENRENAGFAGGSNTGIRRALAASSDFVWLLNNDTTVDPGALLPLVDALGEPDAGIAGSKIYFAAGREYHHDRYAEKERGRILWYAGGSIDWNNMYASHRGVDEIDRGQYDERCDTPFVTGCSMMIARDVFRRTGLLDERYFSYLEDLDFCLSAKRLGYRLLYVPESRVWHSNASSTGGTGNAFQSYYQTRNRLLVAMRFAPLRTKLAVLRESIRFGVGRDAVRRRAVWDAALQRFGRRYVWNA
ncbi:glycosyltransferase family 2 protein [Patescibacteria group bacterium]|nr:glycosyltransferase family 2 protein [Patescibacteria group bacterium]